MHSNTLTEKKRGLSGKLVGTNGVSDAIYGQVTFKVHPVTPGL